MAASLSMPTSDARAWTDAAVRSVHARVEVDRNAEATVTLLTTVAVHGGWLEGFELDGFDPDLRLVEDQPAWARSEGGARYAPRVQVRDGGRVQFSFPGRSPRRGQLVIGFVYRTNLAHRATQPLAETGGVQVDWTLPGWRSGLDGVQIDMVGPLGAEATEEASDQSESFIETSTSTVADGVLLTWRRAHLPRTVPWTVSMQVPASSMLEELGAPPPVRAESIERLTPVLSNDQRKRAEVPGWLFAAALCALCFAKLLHGRSKAGGEAAQPLFSQLPIAPRLLLISGTCGLGGWLLTRSDPWPALIPLMIATFLASHRLGRRPRLSKLGSWQVADRRWLERAKREAWRRQFSWGGALDITSALGLLHALLWLTTPWAIDTFFGLSIPVELAACLTLFALGPLSTGSTLSAPRGPLSSLRRLLTHSAKLRGLPEGVALRPVLHQDVRGAIQDARIRVIVDSIPGGLLRLDLSDGHTRHLGGFGTSPQWLIVTRVGSVAERALAEALPELVAEPSPSGNRVLRLLPASDLRCASNLGRLLAALSHCPSRRARPPVSNAPGETLRQLPWPQAVGL